MSPKELVAYGIRTGQITLGPKPEPYNRLIAEKYHWARERAYRKRRLREKLARMKIVAPREERSNVFIP